MNNSNVVYIKQNRCLTNSKMLAETFGKRHDNILRDIRKQLRNTPESFTLLNFEESKDGSFFEMTQDGFSLIAMSFTGKEAMAFKIAILDEFNRRGHELEKRGLPTKSLADMLEEAAAAIRLQTERADNAECALSEEQVQHENTRLTSLIGSAELVELESAIVVAAKPYREAYGFKADGLIKKLIKAKFSGGRTMGTYKEISKQDFPAVLEWLETSVNIHHLELAEVSGRSTRALLALGRLVS